MLVSMMVRVRESQLELIIERLQDMSLDELVKVGNSITGIKYNRVRIALREKEDAQDRPTDKEASHS